MHDEILYTPGVDQLRQREAHDHTEKLAQAIADAAKRAGIYNGEVPLTGPQLLMLLDDLVSSVSIASSSPQ